MKKVRDISGAILAGGKSSRMGFRKQFLTLKGDRVINVTLKLFKSFFYEIFIVTDDKSRFTPLEQVVAGIERLQGVRIVEDLAKDKGPLGGIYTALKLSSKKGVFFAACDMPLLDKGIIDRLLALSNEGEFDCIIPCTEKGIEPLHGVYFKNILPRLEHWLKGNDFSISKFLKQCNCKYVKAEPEEAASFLNLNTPQDLEELEKGTYGDRYIKDR